MSVVNFYDGTHLLGPAPAVQAANHALTQELELLQLHLRDDKTQVYVPAGVAPTLPPQWKPYCVSELHCVGAVLRAAAPFLRGRGW